MTAWRAIRDAVLLCRVFLRSLRFWGPFAYVLSIGFPVLLFFFLILNLGPQATERMPFLLSGTILAGFINVSVTSVGQYLVQLRLSGGFAVFQTLPIRGISLVLGVVLYYAIMQLPVFLVFGALLPAFGFTRFVNPYFFLAAAMSVLALIPVGAFIGLYARSIQQGSVLSIAVSFLLYMCAPVYVSIDALPGGLQIIARAIPTTYLAENLRSAMLREVDPRRFATNAGVVLLIALSLYGFMGRRLRMVNDE